MRIKYADGEVPARKEHQGYTFLRSHFGQSALRGQANDRARYPAQFERMQCLMRATRFWRTMSPTTRTAWETFAATYPQPQKRNPDLFLSGYQLFLRRNSYCFLNHGATSDFMTTPVLEVATEEAIEFHIRGGTSVVDCTELYIARFGVLPKAGDYLFLKAIVQGEYNGKMYPYYNLKLQVEEVYIDGLFIELTIPETFQGITISLYLSRPVSAGQFYNFSKQRYMGCFTTKKFTELQDTPNTYAGAAGSCVKVNATEDALEFAACGGGGLDCDSLLECPVIEQIVNILDNIIITIIADTGQAIPPVKSGILYNGYVNLDPRKLFSDDSWALPTLADINAIAAYLGGANVAGGKMKLPGTDIWQTPNTGADNSSAFDGYPAGYRTGNTGLFSGQSNYLYLSKSDNYYRPAQLSYNSAYFYNSVYMTAAEKFGLSIRPLKKTTTLQNGQFGTYIGNNGRVYRTVVINGWEILRDNLAETKFRDGSEIPEIQNSAEWVNLTTAALCYINNDKNTV